MKFHYSIASTYSQKALIALYEKGIEFTPSPVNLMDPQAKAEYKKLYPLGKLPLLTSETAFVPESSIIIEYLENEFPESGTKLIPDEKIAARQTRFKDRMGDLYLNNPIVTIYLESLKPSEQQNSEALAKAHETLDMTYAFCEVYLSKNDYIAGDAFTMADCAYFAPLFYAQQMHPFADKPHLTAYFQRLMARPSIQKVITELMPVLQAMQLK